MQAYILDNPSSPSGPSALRLIQLPTPTIGPDEVLVRTKALSINPVDYQTSYGKGAYDTVKDESPLVLGWDIAGEVTEVGANVSRFKAGDAVFGLVNFPGHGRAYAEYVAAPAVQLAPKPATVSHEQAAAATLAAQTAWQALAAANLQPGQRVLIHAAAGGVGHYAVQLAKERGAYVIGTASGANRDFVLRLGADEHVDYTQVKFEDAVAPVDFVLDALGGDNVRRSLQLVKPGGVLASLRGGFTPELLARAQAQQVQTVGVSVASSGPDQHALAERLADGRLRSHIGGSYAFAELVDAVRAVEGGKTQGKVVVTL